MIGIVRLPVETNLGEDAQEVRFLILALCPTNEKGQFNKKTIDHNTNI